MSIGKNNSYSVEVSKLRTEAIKRKDASVISKDGKAIVEILRISDDELASLEKLDKSHRSEFKSLEDHILEYEATESLKLQNDMYRLKVSTNILKDSFFYTALVAVSLFTHLTQNILLDNIPNFPNILIAHSMSLIPVILPAVANYNTMFQKVYLKYRPFALERLKEDVLSQSVDKHMPYSPWFQKTPVPVVIFASDKHTIQDTKLLASALKENLSLEGNIEVGSIQADREGVKFNTEINEKTKIEEWRSKVFGNYEDTDLARIIYHSMNFITGRKDNQNRLSLWKKIVRRFRNIER